jgi:hypothetical protein
MLSKRRSVPKTTETAVLAESRRRCCLCVGLNGDVAEKRGQIAHLDGDPANNAEDNLVFLCLDHHDQFDSSTSQSKGLTRGEIVFYRKQLLQDLALVCSGPLGEALSDVNTISDRLQILQRISEGNEWPRSRRKGRDLLISLLAAIQEWYGEIVESLAKLQIGDDQLSGSEVYRLGFRYIWRRDYLPKVLWIVDDLSGRREMKGLVTEVNSFLANLLDPNVPRNHHY